MERLPGVAQRYARAAFDLARRDGSQESWRENLNRAAELASAPEVGRLARDASLSTYERHRKLDDAVGERVSQPVLNLMHDLLEHDRLELLPAIAVSFTDFVDAEGGAVIAQVHSAMPLSEEEAEKVRGKIEALIGPPVEVRVTVDPSLIGGLTVKIGDDLIDASVRGRLERLRERIKSKVDAPSH